MSRHQTLPDFADEIRQKYPHASELADLRDEASRIVASMLDALTTARSYSGLTQSDVAKTLGVTQPTISRYEKGLENITLRDFVSIALACEQRAALVIAPEDERFSSEDLAREVVRKLIEQLYPDLDVDALFPGPRRRKKAATSTPVRERSPVENQAAVAARAAFSGFANLAVALENLHETKASAVG